MHQRPLWKILWYDGLRVIVRLFCVVVCQIRVRGRGHIPAGGGVLVLSNHQSHLDPPLVGLGFDRRLSFVGRETLFRFAPFRWLIVSLGALPIDREGLGLGGIKETLRRLKRGEMVLFFPEGTRTRDGSVLRFKPGFCALARHAKVPILPVALDGAFTAWPRWQKLPWPATVNVEIGKPITPEQAAKLTDEELVAEVQQRIEAALAGARQSVQRATA